MERIEKDPVSWVWVLRGWKEGSRANTATPWRFTVEDPHTGERHGFISLEALAAYLQAKVSDDDRPGGAGGAPQPPP